MDGFVLKKRKRVGLGDQLKKFYLQMGYRTLFKEYYHTYFTGIKFHMA